MALKPLMTAGLTLIGGGSMLYLAWHAAKNGDARAGLPRVGEDDERVDRWLAQTVKDALAEGRDRVEDTVEEAGERAGDAADAVRARGRDLRDMAGSPVRKARKTAGKIRDRAPDVERILEALAERAPEGAALRRKLSRAGNSVSHAGTEAGRHALRTANRVRATEAARDLAEELDLDLADVEGTGARGIITRADLERAIDRMTRP